MQKRIQQRIRLTRECFGKEPSLSPATLHPNQPSNSGQWEKGLLLLSSATFPTQSTHSTTQTDLFPFFPSTLEFGRLAKLFCLPFTLSSPISPDRELHHQPTFVYSALPRPTFFSRCLLTEYSQFWVCLAARWSRCFDRNFGIASSSRPPCLSSRLLSHQPHSLPSPSLL